MNRFMLRSVMKLKPEAPTIGKKYRDIVPHKKPCGKERVFENSITKKMCLCLCIKIKNLKKYLILRQFFILNNMDIILYNIFYLIHFIILMEKFLVSN